MAGNKKKMIFVEKISSNNLHVSKIILNFAE